MNGNEGHWGGGISIISQNFPKSPSILFHPLESSISQTSLQGERRNTLTDSGACGREKWRAWGCGEKEKCANALRARGKPGGGENNRCKSRWQKKYARIFAPGAWLDGNLPLMPNCFANLLEASFSCFA
jgi:hypothetical protein